MSSGNAESEKRIAELLFEKLEPLPSPKILIGGLGMGFTLRAALDLLPSESQIMVLEIVPEIVEWNRGILGELTNYPLHDPRVEVKVCDIYEFLESSEEDFDAIILDVDNGPGALSLGKNRRIYEDRGILLLNKALKPNAILAIWSVQEEAWFEENLLKNGFTLEKSAFGLETSCNRLNYIIYFARRQARFLKEFCLQTKITVFNDLNLFLLL
jgi:spermidine synthase